MAVYYKLIAFTWLPAVLFTARGVINKIAANGLGIYAVVAFEVHSVWVKVIWLNRNLWLVTCASATNESATYVGG